MAAFKAWVIEKGEAGQSLALRDFDEADLMDGDVTVRVSHSGLNYKDGLAMTGRMPVVRRFPMIPGIDFAGTVEASAHPDYKAGDAVVLTGWGVGETHLGGLAERARVRGDWLVPLPEGLSPAEAMAIGTAGYTAMLSVLALERHGLTPEAGPALVTGASGGVGSVAVALLKRAGWHVIAATGRSGEADYLKGLGAARDPGARGACGRAAPAGQGALGRGHRRGRRPGARQRPVYDEGRRCHRRLRQCRGHGPAEFGRTFHPARGLPAWHQQRDDAARAPPRGLGPARARPRP
ncbi:hypothetical protein M2440_002814 [Methylorubrum extorquens]|nr:hypothetical protein [Methylorubrum extorquens]